MRSRSTSRAGAARRSSSPSRPTASRAFRGPATEEQASMAADPPRPLRVGIAGSGNIGTDLMLKIERSPHLELGGVAGIDPASDGLALASSRGHWTTSDGLADMLVHVEGL